MKAHAYSLYWRLALLVIGLAMVIGGIFRNETGVVFAKASRICLECIGIG